MIPTHRTQFSTLIFFHFLQTGEGAAFIPGVVVVVATLKMSNSSKMSSEPPPPPAESTPLTRQTRSASPVIYFCWLRRRLCCTAVPRGFSNPPPGCDYIIEADWYQLDGRGAPL